jgi:pyrroline-5-carboxylate reductase
MKTIGFLGAGNMAEALIRGLLRGPFEAGQITASGPREERMAELRERFGINATTDNRQSAGADIVILSVKPQILSRVLDEVGGLIRADALVISIAAGGSDRGGSDAACGRCGHREGHAQYAGAR